MRFLCKEQQFQRQKSRTKFFVPITWRCFMITMHIHDSVYSQKVAAKRKYCQLFWIVFKMQEIISWTRGFAWKLDDSSRIYCKGEYQEI